MMYSPCLIITSYPKALSGCPDPYLIGFEAKELQVLEPGVVRSGLGLGFRGLGFRFVCRTHVFLLFAISCLVPLSVFALLSISIFSCFGSLLSACRVLAYLCFSYSLLARRFCFCCFCMFRFRAVMANKSYFSNSLSQNRAHGNVSVTCYR